MATLLAGCQSAEPTALPGTSSPAPSTTHRAQPTASSTTAIHEPDIAVEPCWTGLNATSPIATADIGTPPPRLTNVLARASHRSDFVYEGLAYEGNNIDKRGAME